MLLSTIIPSGMLPIHEKGVLSARKVSQHYIQKYSLSYVLKKNGLVNSFDHAKLSSSCLERTNKTNKKAKTQMKIKIIILNLNVYLSMIGSIF